jgi:Fur family peroxide stress response transcriptional regulator
VEDVYIALEKKITTLSRTTVYNTLRLFADHNAAQMLTIDERRICYDGNMTPHAHFLCKECGKVIDLFGEKMPPMEEKKNIEGNIVTEIQIYYRGICAECREKENKKLN